MAAHTVPVRTDSRDRLRSVTTSAVFDGIAYWCAIVGIYVSYGFLWYYSAKEKLFDQNGTMPAPLAKQFHGSFIASFPGVNTSWLLLGLLEAAAFVLIVASLVSGEFLAGRRKPILLSGLSLSIATFAVMTFAQDMIAGFDSVAQLFAYMTGTVVVMFLVFVMPPYRGRHWLSSFGRQS